MSYAPILAAAFVLWPVMGLLGGQGYSPLLLLTAIAAVFVARPRLPPATYAVIAGLFILWAALTEFWSPASSGFMSGNLLKGNFAIEAASVSKIGLLVCGALTLAALLKTETHDAPRTRAIILIAIGVQLGFVILSALFSRPLLALAYGDETERAMEGMQNLMRNANALSLSLPLLLAWLWGRTGMAWKAGAAACLFVSGIAFAVLDSQAAIFGLIAMALCAAFLFLLPGTGFRWLLGGIAAHIAATPLTMGIMTGLIERFQPNLPESFWSRVYCWQAVIAETANAPMIGHGLMATRTWRDPYSMYPEWLARLPEKFTGYPVVPGHPHNMPLQIWAETGFVGAVIAAFAVLALAFRLPRPEQVSPEVRLASAGLIGAVLCHATFSYSVWNDAFWSSVFLAAGAIILFARSKAADA